MPRKKRLDKIPAGFSLRHTLRGHQGAIFRVVWSPDGQTLASGGTDGLVRLWDAETGQLRCALEGTFEHVKSIAWSLDGGRLASGGNDRFIRVWEVATRQLSAKLEGPSRNISSLAWSPDGQSLAAVGQDKTVRLWDLDDSTIRGTFTQHAQYVSSLAWSPNGRTLAVGDWEGIVWLLDTKTETWSGFQGQLAEVISLAWAPDGKTLAAAGGDKSIRLFDAGTRDLRMILEGHTGYVKSVAFSFDGSLLASKSNDGTVFLWRCATGENVAELRESASNYWLSELAFHPRRPVLATLGENDTDIRIWDLDAALFSGAESPARAVSYTNAKVVLVGDTGVGKTGLGVRLAERVWRPTPGSTHGMNVWTLYSEPEREVMLWDLAGQDEYRLVHQLFLNETNVALLLYDPTKSNDTFFGIEYWEKALKNAVPGDVQKLLVAARVNVGGVRLTTDDIEGYCRARGYLAHFVTSAETNLGCDELRAAIMAAIPWAQLPRTSSPEVFKRIKNFLADIKQGPQILARESDLLVKFKSQVESGDTPTEDQFRTVIGHVETTGLIKRLSFGDFVLLKPEVLNGYAADILDAARRHTDGLGAVRKEDVLGGRITLQDEGGLTSADKIFTLHATVELFLRLGLALEQDGNLVFPSKFNRQMPPLEDPLIEVEFAFAGPVESLYTTLVVKLYYGGIFRLKKLWKNAAEFLNVRERVCGFQLHSEGDGRGTLNVFYAEGMDDDNKALFLKIVADHFKDKRVDIERRRVYRCPVCGEVVRDRRAVLRAVEKKRDKIFCQDCGGSIPLIDALEILYGDDKKFLAQLAEVEIRAEASMERGGDLVSASAELRTESFRAWAAGADIATVAIVFTDVLDSTALNLDVGYERWRQVREAHFARAKDLVERGRGYLIKTIGDAVMAAFHSSGDAVDFALALDRKTGDESVKIRVGVHIGPVEVGLDDAYGPQVSMSARVESKAKDGGIWVSARVKEDVDLVRAPQHRALKWTEHPDEELKGFPNTYTLWSVEE